MARARSADGYERMPRGSGRNPLRVAYRMQKYNAERRGIPFLLSYKDWLSIWRASGKLSKRGKRRDQYVMARRGDKGAYRVGNVQIITVRENSAEYKIRPETRAAISKAMKNRRLSPLHKKRIGIAHKRLGSSIFSAESRAQMSISARKRAMRKSLAERRAWGKRMQRILRERRRIRRGKK